MITSQQIAAALAVGTILGFPNAKHRLRDDRREIYMTLCEPVAQQVRRLHDEERDADCLRWRGRHLTARPLPLEVKV